MHQIRYRERAATDAYNRGKQTYHVCYQKIQSPGLFYLVRFGLYLQSHLYTDVDQKDNQDIPQSIGAYMLGNHGPKRQRRS